LCPEGWEGFHCEFKTGQVPECTLACENDSVCVVGVLNPAEADKLHHIWDADEISDHMRCLCPPEFSGLLCQATTEDCGEDGDQCYNGGTCVTTSTTKNSVTEIEYHCDCTTASDGNLDRFAGRFCESPSTAFCSDDDDNLFCVNGGSCGDDPVEGCNCPQDFDGFKCEFKSKANKPHQDNNKNADTEECGDLYCFNGGRCVQLDLVLEDGTQGTESMCDCSEAYDDTDLYAGSACHYKSTAFCTPPTNEDSLAGISFCVNGGTCGDDEDGTCDCPYGWTGDSCEIHSKEAKDSDDPTCGDDNVCLNGGLCLETGVINEDGSTRTEFYCDCSAAFDALHLYAGESCQFPSTHFCTQQKPEAETLEGMLFCTNHGICRDNPRIGCNCNDGFTGFSCEFEAIDEDPDAADDASDIVQPKTCGDSVCHNGGTCITSMIMDEEGNNREVDHCDCASAVTAESAYAGDECQYEASTFCTLPQGGAGLDSSLFCVNGGTCRDNVHHGCDCPTGWAGFKCDYVVDTEELLDEDGDLEDKMIEQCGVEKFCYNGGTCEISEQVDDNGDLVDAHACDCATAVTDTNLYAGPTCQYKSTSICQEPNRDGLAGSLFCVNHGSCNKDNPLEGCTCPYGWTGAMCEFRVEDDEHADKGEECGDDYCYNGGSCVTTKIISEDGTERDEFHCDCATAFDDANLFAGESCEHKSTALCSRSRQEGSLEGVLFCVNGGKCGDIPQQGCDCPPEWTGLSCAFETEPEDIADTDDDDLEQCGDLVCLNGGMCTTTIIEAQGGERQEKYHCDCAMAFTETDIYAGPQCEFKSTNFCTQPNTGSDLAGVIFCVNGGKCDKDNVLKGCECPLAWTGLKCELKGKTEDSETEFVDHYVQCGDDYCYNGGSCQSSQVNGEARFSCDCTSAVTATHLYDGQSCQYESTALCSESGGDSLLGVEFCVNGGQCESDDACHCPSGYDGKRCELTLYEDQDSEDSIAPDEDDGDFEYQGCHLQCQNGGHCAKGAKDLGSLHDTVEHVGHLNKTYDDEFFEHCVCQEGFIGLECAHEAAICGENEHVCLHGSTCVIDKDKHSCDCSKADTEIGHAVFAGDSCQHPATDICLQGEDYPGRPLYFCVNQGKCKDYVTQDEADPGCGCLQGWSGPHCEIRIQSLLVTDESSGIAEWTTTKIVLVFAFFFAVVVVVCAILCLRRRRDANMDDPRGCMYFGRRRRAGFGDPADQKDNLAPMRLDAQDLPTVFSSSSDPITAGLTLPPDDEPEPYYDEPVEPYEDEPTELYYDEPVLVNIGPPRDEDGHELHNVDFI
jgi:hypothetical protein